ncbi:hypothetical protein B0T16DRAFT_171536 [Cercophora newfieldiana]|uniref:Uncharacterized protein n=1 Tax=Cercophora newfieldiana TaxID=92897 RepID=A0AA40CQ46_9PEZI|nr:hypothetical protein B0T16DRAFT_171536 [Cercophora newfieldiana]
MRASLFRKNSPLGSAASCNATARRIAVTPACLERGPPCCVPSKAYSSHSLFSRRTPNMRCPICGPQRPYAGFPLSPVEHNAVLATKLLAAAGYCPSAGTVPGWPARADHGAAFRSPHHAARGKF